MTADPDIVAELQEEPSGLSRHFLDRLAAFRTYVDTWEPRPMPEHWTPKRSTR